MRFYRNILASAFLWYDRNGEPVPYAAAIGVVAGSHLTMLFLIWTIAGKIVKYDIHPDSHIAVYVIISVVTIDFGMLYLFYPQKKVIKYAEEFQKRSKRERLMWRIISLSSFFVPFLLAWAIDKW